MYSINIIADWFLNKETMTHKKLQKLCYYAYAWHYALKGVKLCNDTQFQAWVHGPVSPELYSRFKGSSWNDLLPASSTIDIDKSTLELLESVWETYGELNGNALEALSHTEPPWINARIGLEADQLSNRIITDESMLKYYSSIYIGGEE